MAAPLALSRRRLLQAGSAWMGLSALGLAAEPARAPALRFGTGLGCLRTDLKGRLLYPGDEAFPMAAFPNNARWANVQPVAIAMCADASDVQLSVQVARDYGIPFAIRSGGHSYAGFSTTEGLLIDVKSMYLDVETREKIRRDEKNGTVTIAGGVNNQDMADALHNTSFAVPSGRCPTVGASGLVLGGGWGFAATHSGLTCDWLDSTEIVLADGRKVVASEREHPDLFWALRGGGGGNFGVNTSFTFRLKDVGKVTIFNITWPGRDRQVDLLLKLQQIQLAHPDVISTRTKALPPKPSPFPKRQELLVTTLGIYWGGSDDLRKIMEPAFQAAGVEPISQDIRAMDYWQARDYLITDDPTGLYDLRNLYVSADMDESARMKMIDRSLFWMSKWPGGSLLPENMGIFFAIGGKVREVKAEATAYVHRDANFIFEMETAWGPIDRPEVVDAQQRWLREYFADIRHYVPSTRSYVNFPNRELPDWANAYYGSNLPRLSKVKRCYDRDNIFRFEQSIPLAGGSDPCN